MHPTSSHCRSLVVMRRLLSSPSPLGLYVKRFLVDYEKNQAALSEEWVPGSGVDHDSTSDALLPRVGKQSKKKQKRRVADEAEASSKYVGGLLYMCHLSLSLSLPLCSYVPFSRSCGVSLPILVS
jgi:hypothetical protein